MCVTGTQETHRRYSEFAVPERAPPRAQRGENRVREVAHWREPHSRLVTAPQSQLPAFCVYRHILSKQDGNVLSSHHHLRRMSSELSCLMFGISLSLALVYLSILTPHHSPSGPQVALKPEFGILPTQGFHRGSLQKPPPSSRTP